jgi:glucose/mannose transport system substrate-binding protein
LKIHSKNLLALLIAGLGAATAAHAQKAEVIHWWTSGGEAAAIKEMANAFTQAGGTWIDAPIAGGGGANARTVTLNRTMGGDPPTAAQFNYSNQYREAIKEGLLNSIDEVAIKEGWDKMLPESIKKSIKIDGKYYAAPVNLHMPYWVWSNKAVLTKAGVTKDPVNMEEMFVALDKVKATGAIPLALGGQGWQEAIMFRSVLLSTGGRDLWMKVYRDRDAATINGPTFRKALDNFKKLKSYVDPGSPGRDWNLASAMVIQGKAGFQYMGDWAKGEFVQAGQTAGKEYGCFMAGGPKSPYVIGGDVFVFPKSDKPETRAAQMKLAALITSPAVQVAFNNKKGSIPIRTDVDLTKVDICAKAGVEAMKENRLLESNDQLMSPDANGAFEDAVGKFWNSNQSVDDVLKAINTALKL